MMTKIQIMFLFHEVDFLFVLICIVYWKLCSNTWKVDTQVMELICYVRAEKNSFFLICGKILADRNRNYTKK
jgi:uncharacterized membrane protein